MQVIYWELRYFICEYLHTFYYSASSELKIDEESALSILNYLDVGEYVLAFEAALTVAIEEKLTIGQYRYQLAKEIAIKVGLDSDSESVLTGFFWSKFQAFDPQ